jgi:hypothetical protein
MAKVIQSKEPNLRSPLRKLSGLLAFHAPVLCLYGFDAISECEISEDSHRFHALAFR